MVAEVRLNSNDPYAYNYLTSLKSAKFSEARAAGLFDKENKTEDEKQSANSNNGSEANTKGTGSAKSSNTANSSNKATIPNPFSTVTLSFLNMSNPFSVPSNSSTIQNPTTTTSNPFSNTATTNTNTTDTALNPTFKKARVGKIIDKARKSRNANQFEAALSSIKEDPTKVQLKKGTAAKALELALNEASLGIKEGNGSFKKYTQGRNVPWCALFMNWVYETTCGGNGASPFGYLSVSRDSKGNPTDGQYLPYVSNLAEWAKQQGIYINKNKVDVAGSANNSTGTNTVKPGDIVIFGNGMHVGMVKSIDADGTVHTVEGNADDTVKERTWNINDNSGQQIFGFIQMNRLEA